MHRRLQSSIATLGLPEMAALCFCALPSRRAFHFWNCCALIQKTARFTPRDIDTPATDVISMTNSTSRSKKPLRSDSMKLKKKIQDALLVRKLYFISALIETTPYALSALAAVYATYSWTPEQNVRFGLRIALVIAVTVLWLIKLYEAYGDIKQ